MHRWSHRERCCFRHNRAVFCGIDDNNLSGNLNLNDKHVHYNYLDDHHDIAPGADRCPG